MPGPNRSPHWNCLTIIKTNTPMDLTRWSAQLKTHPLQVLEILKCCKIHYRSASWLLLKMNMNFHPTVVPTVGAPEFRNTNKHGPWWHADTKPNLNPKCDQKVVGVSSLPLIALCSLFRRGWTTVRSLCQSADRMNQKSLDVHLVLMTKSCRSLSDCLRNAITVGPVTNSTQELGKIWNMHIINYMPELIVHRTSINILAGLNDALMLKLRAIKRACRKNCTKLWPTAQRNLSRSEFTALQKSVVDSRTCGTQSEND